VCAPRARSSAWDGQPVTHERHRRGVIFGVDGGLADGGGLGAAAIHGTAGEADGAPAWRLAGGRGPATARRPANNKRGGGALVRQVACGDLRKVATKCVSRCLTEQVRTATGERGSQRAGLRRAARAARCRRQRRSALQAEGQERIRGSEGAPGRLTFPSLRGRKAHEHQQRPDCACATRAEGEVGM
jgi:hypothetical protein